MESREGGGKREEVNGNKNNQNVICMLYDVCTCMQNRSNYLLLIYEKVEV